MCLAPRRLRLSLGDDPLILVVTWDTDGPCMSASVCVQWLAGLGQAAAGQTPVRQVPLHGLGDPQLQCSTGTSVAFYDLGVNATTKVVHSMTLAGVPPGRAFLYRVTADPQGEKWSTWHSAVGPALSALEETRLLVLGDMGYYNAPALPGLLAESRAAMQAGRAFHAAVHIGDLAYDLHSYGGSRGSRFLEAVEPLTASVPYMVAPGNHEAGPWNFSHYRRVGGGTMPSLFRMPAHTATENLYYSFDVGLVHVMVYNTEVFFWPEVFGEDHMRAMLQWMEADLKDANARREAHPWVLAVGHRPMYCVSPLETSGRCHEESEASRGGVPSYCPHNNPLACKAIPGRRSFPVEPLLHAYGVDLAVYGHVHDYERYFPVINYTVLPTSTGTGNSGVYVNPRATVHVTAGGAGNSEMRRGECDPPQGSCSPAATWCAFQSGYGPRGCESADHSYARVTAVNATHLHWQQWSHTFGRVVDDWWIDAAMHGPFGA